MKKNIISFFLFALCSVFTLFAQKKEWKISELMSAELGAPKIQQLRFLRNANAYIYAQKDTLYAKDFNAKSPRIIFTLSQLQQFFKEEMRTPIHHIPEVFMPDREHLIFLHDQSRYSYNILKKEFRHLWSIPKGSANQNFNPKEPGVAFTINNNLFYIREGMKYSVSQEANPKIKYGQIVYRNEFGVKEGIFWAPDARSFAFYRNDETAIPDYPLVQYEKEKITTVQNEPYPMAGTRSQNVSVGVYNMENFQTVFLEKMPNQEDAYMVGITWHPNARDLYVIVLSRTQKHLQIICYNAQTGERKKVLYEEFSEKYVEPLTPLYFRRTESNEFIWLSRKDGFKHLYKFDTEKGIQKQLTSGNWEVLNVLGIGPEDKRVLFTANKDNPLEEQLYSVDIQTGEIKRITKEAGVHSIEMHQNGKYFIDRYSNSQVASVVQVIDINGQLIDKIQYIENPLQDYSMPKTEIFTIKAADDSTDLYARLIKPSHFDSTKKYPVIVYVYGGPHNQLIRNRWLWGASLFHQYLAEQGYLVFTVDSRGSANRGFEFESAIYRQIGQVEIADQMRGVAYLKNLSFVDTSRIGVDGWSYGGYMTIHLKLNYPEVFKVATAGGPVIDWSWYEVMYGERYMSTPDDNPYGYQNASLLNMVDKLEGKLMVMYGNLDEVVLPIHTFSFIEACIKKNKQVDLFVFPTHRHNVMGQDRTYLFQKIYDYFQQNL